MVNTLATSVVGDHLNDVFHIWSGTGANGKGLTNNLVATSFGEYYYEPSACLFASQSISGLVPSSELAKLKGKRVVIASEAEPGDKHRYGVLKQCSGHVRFALEWCTPITGMKGVEYDPLAVMLAVDSAIKLLQDMGDGKS
jgi:hypothetical protein